MLIRRRLQAMRPRVRPSTFMTKDEFRSALRRAIILEYQNGKSKPYPRWGRERPPSMYVLRVRRLRLCYSFVERYPEPISSLLFARNLPQGKSWPGTRLLLSAPIFSWVNGVWTQIGCTVPLYHTTRQKTSPTVTRL